MEGEELRGRKRVEEEKGRGVEERGGGEREGEAGERGEDKKSLSGGGMMGVIIWNLNFSP